MQLENEKVRNTYVTSVSLSKEFKRIMDENNISPTNAMRKGVAVELYELGLIKYQSETNKIRKEKTKEFFKFMEKVQEFAKHKDFVVEKLQSISSKINSILIDMDDITKKGVK